MARKKDTREWKNGNPNEIPLSLNREWKICLIRVEARDAKEMVEIVVVIVGEKENSWAGKCWQATAQE